MIEDRFRGFGKADLADWRDAGADVPQATLAGKLYRRALNKVVAISAAEAAFLDGVLANLPRSEFG